jgi:moderate conductance mechanosensitive channel
VLLVLGALLLARFVTWSGRRITERIDAAATDGDALVRSEAAKHRHAVTQVLTWLSIALIWSVTAVQVLGRASASPWPAWSHPLPYWVPRWASAPSRWCGT